MASPRQTIIAVDTNVLIDLAAKTEIVLDCFATIRERLPHHYIVVLPTVILEITDTATESDDAADRALAMKAIQNLREWNFHPENCVPVGHGIVEEIGRKLRRNGLIPDEEVHDSFIVAEAALRGATILISSDKHLRDIDYKRLKIELDASDVDCPLIASPWKIVHDFFQKK